MHPDIQAYNARQLDAYRAVCERLAGEMDSHLPDADSRIWHAHPVWFLAGNPVAGYSLQKPGIRLMFWSGADFGEAALDVEVESRWHARWLVHREPVNHHFSRSAEFR